MANNIGGLAALGALGYLLSQRQDGSKVPVEDRSTYSPAAAPQDNSGAFYEAGSGPTSEGGMNEQEPGWSSGQAQPTISGRRPVRIQPQAQAQPQPVRYPSQGRPATGPVTYNQGATPAPVYPSQGRPATGPVTYNQGARYGADAIPGQSVRAPQGGERVDNPSEFRRIMEAAGPARLAGIGNMATEALTAGRVQRAYNAQQAARRAAEGLSPAEAAAAKARLAEAAFEGGMKKGGKVKPKAKAKTKPKKMASGGMTSRPNASKRADGIATKGHTKCKIR